VKRDYKIRTQNPSCSEADTTYTGKSLNRKTARKADRVGSPAACQGLCQQRKECKFFSWGRKGCWLKKTQGKTRRRRGYVSGPATCEPPKPPIVSTPKPSSSTKPVIITEGPGRGNPCKNGGTKVDGAWTKWFEVGDCNCQTGRKLMVRSCSSPAPEYGGQKCQGDFFTEKACDKNNCAVNGGWSKWRKVGTCNCETENEFYVRECNNPTPILGGQICVGASYEERACKTNDCHVDGGWGQWTEGGSCNCQTGRQVLVRQCKSPPPKNRGQMCQGNAWKEAACSPEYCPKYPEEVEGGTVDPFWSAHSQNPDTWRTGCQTTKGDNCVFPFTYKGVVYDKCTKADHSKPWCSTKTNIEGHYISGHWGDCSPTCLSGIIDTGYEPLIPGKENNKNTRIDRVEGSSSGEIGPDLIDDIDYGSTEGVDIYDNSEDGIIGEAIDPELSGDGGDIPYDPDYPEYGTEYPIHEYEDK